MVSILRPGQRILNIPAIGVATSRRAVASAAADWWAVTGKTCQGAYLAKNAASYAASKVNLANPGTHDATNGLAYPSWDTATGWTCSGTQYLDTGVVPASGFSAIVRFSGLLGNATFLGEYVAGARFDIGRYEGLLVFGSGDVSYATWTPVTSGIIGIAGQQGYWNGAASGATIGAWTTTTTKGLYIGNRNGANDFLTGNIQAVAIYSDTLTAGDFATVSAAMAAL